MSSVIPTGRQLSGLARAASMSAEERSASARHASRCLWGPPRTAKAATLLRQLAEDPDQLPFLRDPQILDNLELSLRDALAKLQHERERMVG